MNWIKKITSHFTLYFSLFLTHAHAINLNPLCKLHLHLDLIWESCIFLHQQNSCICIQQDPEENYYQQLATSYSKMENDHKIWKNQTVEIMTNLLNPEQNKIQKKENENNETKERLNQVRTKVEELNKKVKVREEELKKYFIEASDLHYEVKELEKRVEGFSTRPGTYLIIQTRIPF